LKRAAEGDEKAFSELVSAYNERLIKIARVFVGGEAEDIAQEVWLKIYRYREKLSEVENLDKWLYLVVRRRCLDELRKKHAGRSISYEENVTYIERFFKGGDILEGVMDRLDSAAVRERLEALEEVFKIPMLLYYYQDIPLQEVARILGVSYATAKRRLYTGRQKLKKSLGGCFNE
jgi:RNA polymerase sigma-70 factor (ECF subfamily)